MSCQPAMFVIVKTSEYKYYFDIGFDGKHCIKIVFPDELDADKKLITFCDNYLDEKIELLYSAGGDKHLLFLQHFFFFG